MGDAGLGKADEIARALIYYQQSFTANLSTVVSIAEIFPDEINNEIRNAFTHIARAQASESHPEIKDEVDKAIAHIERASRDCLKVSIMFERDKLENLISDVWFFYGKLTPTLMARYESLKQLRKAAYAKETLGYGGMTKRLEEILLETVELRTQIELQYREARVDRIRHLRAIKRWSRPVLTVIGAIIGGVVTYFARDYIQAGVEYFVRLLTRH